jgi:hypothetical protein
MPRSDARARRNTRHRSHRAPGGADIDAGTTAAPHNAIQRPTARPAANSASVTQ